MTGKQGLDQPLGDDIGKAPVGGCGVGVVLDREAKVALLWISRAFQHIFAGSNEFDHAQRKIREVIGISGFASQQKIVERFGVGLRRKLSLYVAASCTIRSQRSGVFTMRRRDETLSSMRATTPLAAIMKSSISSVAWFLCWFSTSTTC